MGARQREGDLHLGERTRDRLLLSSRRVFADIQTDMDSESRSLMRLMEEGASRDDLMPVFQAWRIHHDDLLDAESEMRRLTPERDLYQHDMNVRAIIGDCRNLCNRVNDFLERHPPRSDSPADLYRATVLETERLGSELRRMEAEIRVSESQTRVHNEPHSRSSLRESQAGASASAPVLGADRHQGVTWGDYQERPPYHAAEGDRENISWANTRGNAIPLGYPGYSMNTNFSNNVPLSAPPLDPTGAMVGPPSRIPAMTASTNVAPAADVSTSLLHRLADILECRDQRLPPLEPPVFSGDILSFPSWLTAFSVSIEQRARTEQEKLVFLGKYTRGEAKEAIQYYLVLQDQEDGFARAKQTLMARYGDKVLISETFRKRLDSWPSIKKGDADGLQKYSDFLHQARAAMDSMSYLDVLNSRDENRRLAQKLPWGLAERWDRVVDRWMYGPRDGDSSLTRLPSGSYPPFEEFCNFVADEARVARSSCVMKLSTGNASARDVSQPRDEPRTKRQGVRHTVLATATQQDKHRGARQTEQSKCAYCEKPHPTIKCYKLQNKSPDERKAWARSVNACFGCYQLGHRYQSCRNKDSSASVTGGDRVTGQNAGDSRPGNSSSVEEKAVSLNTYTRISNYSTMMVMVQIYHVRDPDLVFTVCAALDTQSDSCFIRNELAQKLGIEERGRKVRLGIDSMGRRCAVDTLAFDDLRICSLDDGKSIHLPQCYGRDSIPGNTHRLPTRDNLMKWTHLREVGESWPGTDHVTRVSLLIGYNVPEAFGHDVTLTGKTRKEPFAMLTDLGWAVMGDLNAPDSRKNVLCFKTATKELAPADINDAFDHEFSSPSRSDKKLSSDDLRFLEILTKGLKRLEDGRLEMPLPFREDPTALPNNRSQAVGRLLSQKKKFRRLPDYHRKYSKTFADMLTNREAEKVPIYDINNPLSWYLSHQGIEREDKPDVVRVVHDPTPEFEGICLNSLLLSGPDMLNNLSGVLMRFRRELIGYACDIKGMFLQFRVTPWMQNFFRFVWFEDGNLDGEIVDYRMTSHLFGATSSPGVANFAMKHLSELYRGKYGDRVADFVRDEFYVDDGMGSDPTVEEAERVLLGSRALLGEARLDLRKFSSNSRELLSRLPAELLADDVRESVSTEAPLPTGKNLGMYWDKERDQLRYVLREVRAKPTRRSMLSLLSGVYDPLGFIGPVLLPGRRLLQQLCRRQVGWDDPVDYDVFELWQAWEDDLSHLNKLEIARCLKTKELGTVSRRELHTFTDAATVGLGACCYVVQRGETRTDSCLVYGKSRVPPTKPVTVPRLELQAAVLGAKIAVFVEEELRMPSLALYFWTDSSIVLAYIKNSSKRLHLYVRNRVQTIRELTDTRDWRHVATDQNPADLASRGCSARELASSSLWLKGPEFLLSPIPNAEEEVIHEEISEIPDGDPEVMNVTVLNTSATELSSENPVMDGLSRCSSWTGMIATVAVWRRWLLNLRSKVRGATDEIRTSPLTVEERSRAEALVVSAAQRDAYPREFTVLQSDRDSGEISTPDLRRKSKLYSLDAFMSADGTLRVGGRIKKSLLPPEVSQPRILPSKHHVSRALVRHIHGLSAHPGRTTTVSAVRLAGYWVCQARATVASEIGRCVICSRHRGRRVHQQMSDLPAERLSESPPFTYCGMDCFGPMSVKEKRSLVKRWGILFTCLSMRGIHLEILVDMTADSVILAFRRLTNRRGPVRTIFCDQGTNFTGADRQIAEAFQEMNLTLLQERLSQRGCDLINLKFIPPHAPHMGGVWERQVQSAKRVFSKLIAQHGYRLDDPVLYTLATEVESIMNSRPLTVMDESDPEAPVPLTPSRILTLKSQTVAPLPGAFVPEDLYLKTRWKKVELLANAFWEQWRSDYLPSLQLRTKWTSDGTRLQVGDIVIEVDKTQPRNRWPLARVQEIHPSDDGRVRRVTISQKGKLYERAASSLILLHRPCSDTDDRELD